MTDHAPRPTGARRALGTVPVVAAAVALAGCGPDLDTPEGTTRAFVDAMAERDWAGACELLSHDFVHRSMDGNSQYCPTYLERWHQDTDSYRPLVVRGEASATEEGYRLEVAPEGAPDRTEEVVVVEESGRLVLLRYPGTDTATR
jgi:hypothetical protein